MNTTLLERGQLAKDAAYEVIAPDGTPITAVRETLLGDALILGVSVNSDGRVDMDYEGETKVDWNSQVPVLRRGKRIFIDEKGREWTESQVRFREQVPV